MSCIADNGMTETPAFLVAVAEAEVTVDDACTATLAVDAAAVGRVVAPAPVADVLFKLKSFVVDDIGAGYSFGR
jgi:hypothetical protein